MLDVVVRGAAAEEEQGGGDQKRKIRASTHHHHQRWATASPSKRSSFFLINDHVDVLVEILKRMDARTLGRSACVCRLWASICLHDSLWENLIVRHLSLRPPPSYASSLRPVVLALGGFRRLYTACVRPLLAHSDRPVRSWDEVQLSLSLLSVDCYERRLIGGAPGAASSLRLLCELVNV